MGAAEMVGRVTARRPTGVHVGLAEIRVRLPGGYVCVCAWEPPGGRHPDPIHARSALSRSAQPRQMMLL